MQATGMVPGRCAGQQLTIFQAREMGRAPGAPRRLNCYLQFRLPPSSAPPPTRPSDSPTVGAGPSAP
eukprot:8240151-Alexandrium_andersonii.AAC.1